jgi:hypothetical protein
MQIELTTHHRRRGLSEHMPSFPIAIAIPIWHEFAEILHTLIWCSGEIARLRLRCAPTTGCDSLALSFACGACLNSLRGEHLRFHLLHLLLHRDSLTRLHGRLTLLREWSD